MFLWYCAHCVFLSLVFQSCQADLVKDNGHKYFLSVLADPYMPVRTNHLYSDSSGVCLPCLGLSAAVRRRSVRRQGCLPPPGAPPAPLGRGAGDGGVTSAPAGLPGRGGQTEREFANLFKVL